MSFPELYQELKETFIQNVDEHPLVTYLTVLLGSLLTLIVLYYLYNGLLYALHFLR